LLGELVLAGGRRDRAEAAMLALPGIGQWYPILHPDASPDPTGTSVLAVGRRRARRAAAWARFRPGAPRGRGRAARAAGALAEKTGGRGFYAVHNCGVPRGEDRDDEPFVAPDPWTPRAFRLSAPQRQDADARRRHALTGLLMIDANGTRPGRDGPDAGPRSCREVARSSRLTSPASQGVPRAAGRRTGPRSRWTSVDRADTSPVREHVSSATSRWGW